MNTTISNGGGARLRGDTVTLTRAEYESLLARAGEDVRGAGPALPEPDSRGRVPAVEYIRASIARRLIRERTAAGLSQTQLARRAGIRQETVSRIESAKHTVSQRVMARIERAIERAMRSRRSSGRVRGKRKARQIAR